MNVGIPIWMILVALLMGLTFASLLYLRNKKQHYGKALTSVLFLIRALAISIITLLLFNPFIRQKSKVTEDPTIVIVHDNSASIVLEKDSAFNIKTYLDSLQRLRESLKDNFHVDSYLFGKDFREGETPDFQDQVTDMTHFFKALEQKYYKQNVGAVILLSDGIYNRGFAPELVSEKFPFPIYSVILGDTISYPDLSIKEVYYNKTVSIGTLYPIKVMLNAKDFNNQKAKVVLSVDGKEFMEQTVDISSNRFTKEIDFLLQADEQGVRQIDIKVSGLENEAQLLNNSKRIFVEVLDQKYKILVIAQSPHPDLTALRSVLNDNYEVDFSFAKDELNEEPKYDLIVMHQAPCSTTNDATLKRISDHNKKAPLLFIIGDATDLPMLNDMQGIFNVELGATKSILDAKAYANPAFGSFNTEEKLGELISKFPPLSAPYLNINPLLPHDDLLLQDVLGIKSGNPLISLATDANGRKTGFVFGTNFWRWRLFDFYQRKNHDIFDDIFSKTLKYLLMDADKESSIYCKEEYFSNEPVLISAELRNPSGELTTEPELSIRITNKITEEAYDYVFAKKDHSYELNCGLLPEGIYTYQATAELAGKAISARGTFTVIPASLELQQLTAEADRMRSIANATNGKSYAADELSKLYADLQNDKRITSVEHQEIRFEELIHFKFLFFIIIALLALEWVLRKMYGTY
jgi:hypothetical protein